MEITWKLNGNDIRDNIDIITSKVGKRISVLSIESVTAYHAGNYTCRAKNRAGEADNSALLIVIGLLIDFLFSPKIHFISISTS